MSTLVLLVILICFTMYSQRQWVWFPGTCKNAVVAYFKMLTHHSSADRQTKKQNRWPEPRKLIAVQLVNTNDPSSEPDHIFPTISLRPISKLFIHLRLVLASALFPSIYPTKILYAFLAFSAHAMCSAHLLDTIALEPFGEQQVL